MGDPRGAVGTARSRAAQTDAAPIAGVDLDVDALLNLRHVAYRMRDIRKAPRSALPGDIIHPRRGRGLEVHDVRPWSEGDDIRHLDQNTTARTGVPHTKTYFDERERSLVLLADFRPPMLFGTRRAFRSVAGAEALALLGWRWIGHGGRLGLLTVNAGGVRFSSQGRGERAMIAAIGALAEAHREALADRNACDVLLSDALATAVKLASRGSTIIIATGLDTADPQLAETVLRASHLHDLVFLLVEDAFDEDPPPGDYPFNTDEGRSGWLRIGKHRSAPRDPVADLRRLGVNALRFSADDAAERVIASLELIVG